MPETVCVTVEQLREIEVQVDDEGRLNWCPACEKLGMLPHEPDCWLANAIARAERLKDWAPVEKDRVKLRAMPEIRGKIAKIFYKTAYIQVDGEPEDWRLDRYLAELMPEEGE